MTEAALEQEKEADLTIQIIEKFEPFMEPHRYKIAYGGRGSSKSWAIAQLLVLRAYQQRTRVLCAREIQKSINDWDKQLNQSFEVKMHE